MSTYIKEIILENFLSHKYSRIPLKKGVNLITGPNGSGKSSILIGISVALGQSYTERSRKLSDLITYGEEAARVSLIMDNSPIKGKRPFPSSSLDQVMITRVIRKDGNYWFEFNQEVIEKFQLQRMLKRLGINPDNELIIMHQNMIEEFITKDPIERLRLFEEAVGIGDYRRHVLNSIGKLSDIEKGSQGVYQSLKNIEINLKYWKNLYQKYERKIKLIETISSLKNELFWANYNELKKKVEKLREEINYIYDKRNKVNSEISYLKNKVNELKDMILDELKKAFVFNEIIKKIEEYSDFKASLAVNSYILEILNSELKNKLSLLEEAEEDFKKLEQKKKVEKVEVRRTIQEIESELRDLQAELKSLGEINEEIPINYNNYLKQYEELKAKIKEIEENKEKTKEELKQRMQLWTNIIVDAVTKVDEIFRSVISKIDGIGFVALKNADDIEKASLEISVGFRGTSPVLLNSFSQSGGERTATIIAFLLACQQYMKSSIRAVDEFDVHMDPINKERVSILLSSLPKDNPDIQYIFITPDPMIQYFKDSNIIIVAKQGGISGVGSI
ncbi:MAG TPA: AAA family ATPase [Geobacterales bacterium]|nr:AAA family ATPase [Geobacterales bacterium]